MKWGTSPATQHLKGQQPSKRMGMGESFKKMRGSHVACRSLHRSILRLCCAVACVLGLMSLVSTLGQHHSALVCVWLGVGVCARACELHTTATTTACVRCPKSRHETGTQTPAKGDAQGKEKRHVQKFKMRHSLTKKGFVSEPVNA